MGESIRVDSIIHNQPQLVQIVLHTTTFLLIYAYVKEHIQLPVVLVFTFSYIGIARWLSHKIKVKHGISRINYLLPTTLFAVFTLLFEKLLRDEDGKHGGLDDNKYIVRHRKIFWLLLLAIMSYVFMQMLRIRRRRCQMAIQENHSKAITTSIMSILSTPITFCSGGACNSIYASTVTSLLSSFSIPLTVIVPFLNVIGFILQGVGLVSLYSVKKFRYAPFWAYLICMCAQLVLDSWICGLGMLAAVIWNAKYHKYTFGRKAQSSV